MPPPNQGTGKTSSLRSALSHPDREVQDKFIDKIAKVYGEEQDMIATAEKFGCGIRTLERAVADFPRLKAAIDKIRNDLAATGG